jgi:hypothetical protein
MNDNIWSLELEDRINDMLVSDIGYVELVIDIVIYHVGIATYPINAGDIIWVLGAIFPSLVH